VSVPVENLFAPQGVPNVAAGRIVNGENMYRYAADLRSSDQVGAIPFRVLVQTRIASAKMDRWRDS
jgi:hypothetical protein